MNNRTCTLDSFSAVADDNVPDINTAATNAVSGIINAALGGAQAQGQQYQTQMQLYLQGKLPGYQLNENTGQLERVSNTEKGILLIGLAVGGYFLYRSFKH